MNVPIWLWVVTVAGLLILFVVDLFVVDSKPHEISVREATKWIVFYAAVTAAFAAGLATILGGQIAGVFSAGYITEYVMSLDGLFVIMVIMYAFAVPKILAHRVLSFGVLGMLVLRGSFVAVGAFVLQAIYWVLYFLGAFLVYASYNLSRKPLQDADYVENIALRWARRIVPMTAEYHGARTVVRLDGNRYCTPMLMVMLAIATTNVTFAVTSVSATFSLTKDAFLVFTANAFALLGLRQLYFLVEALRAALRYLNTGLVMLLGFIGVKLILEAMSASGVYWAPRLDSLVYLATVVVTLVVTVVASLVKARRYPGSVP